MKTLGRIVLTLARIWLGYSWLTAGLEKLSNPAWVGDKAGVAISGFFQGAIAKAVGEHPTVQGWYATFLKDVALPHARFFSYLVPTGEVLTGLALILGVVTTFALFVSAFMNLNFLLAGSGSTGPVMYTLAIILLVSGSMAHEYGIDRFLLPRIAPYWQRLWGRADNRATAGAR